MISWRYTWIHFEKKFFGYTTLHSWLSNMHDTLRWTFLWRGLVSSKKGDWNGWYNYFIVFLEPFPTHIHHFYFKYTWIVTPGPAIALSLLEAVLLEGQLKAKLNFWNALRIYHFVWEVPIKCLLACLQHVRHDILRHWVFAESILRIEEFRMHNHQYWYSKGRILLLKWLLNVFTKMLGHFYVAWYHQDQVRYS